MTRKKTEGHNGLPPSGMRRKKYVGDGDLRESENSRANPRETFEAQKIRAKELVAIHGTIELRE